MDTIATIILPVHCRYKFGSFRFVIIIQANIPRSCMRDYLNVLLISKLGKGGKN